MAETKTTNDDLNPSPSHTTVAGSNHSKRDAERGVPNTAVSLWKYLMEDVDSSQTTAPLAAYCFMTGYMCVNSNIPSSTITNTRVLSLSDVISFSAIFVWCGFQTGNFAQVRSPTSV